MPIGRKWGHYSEQRPDEFISVVKRELESAIQESERGGSGDSDQVNRIMILVTALPCRKVHLRYRAIILHAFLERLKGSR